MSSTEYSTTSLKRVLKIDNLEKIAKERDKIKTYNEKIDYYNKLLYASLNNIIYNDDISLFEEIKDIISKHSLACYYDENTGLFNEYNSNLQQLNDLFNNKISEAFRIINQNVKDIENNYVNKINQKKGYFNPVKKRKEFLSAKEDLSKNHKQFRQIKGLIEK